MTRCPGPICNAGDTCDRCHRTMASWEELWESGTEYVCEGCFERKIDEAEARMKEMEGTHGT